MAALVCHALTSALAASELTFPTARHAHCHLALAVLALATLDSAFALAAGVTAALATHVTLANTLAAVAALAAQFSLFLKAGRSFLVRAEQRWDVLTTDAVGRDWWRAALISGAG